MHLRTAGKRHRLQRPICRQFSTVAWLKLCGLHGELACPIRDDRLYHCRAGGLLLGFASTSIRVGIEDRGSLHFFQPGLGILAALAEEEYGSPLKCINRAKTEA